MAEMLPHMLSVYAFFMYMFLFMTYINNLVSKIQTYRLTILLLLGNSLDYLIPETDSVSGMYNGTAMNDHRLCIYTPT